MLTRPVAVLIRNQVVLALPPDATVRTACQRMRERYVGSVVVADERNHLLGIFTERDAVCRVLAEGRDADHTTVAKVMTTEVATVAPQLLTEPGFGPLTAAKLVGEVAGGGRFSSDAKLARAAGVAPIPVSSGNTNRHRLDRGGNRQINATIHRIAVTRLRCHPETQDYIARKRSEGKSTKEAIRCLKRHLARRIWHLLQTPNPEQGTPPTPSIS